MGRSDSPDFRNVSRADTALHDLDVQDAVDALVRHYHTRLTPFMADRSSGSLPVSRAAGDSAMNSLHRLSQSATMMKR